jgi:hypothetical protein
MVASVRLDAGHKEARQQTGRAKWRAGINIVVLVFVLVFFFVVAHVHLLQAGLRFGPGLEDAEADYSRWGRLDIRGGRRPLVHDGALLRRGIANDVVFLVMDFRLGARRRSRECNERA